MLNTVKVKSWQCQNKRLVFISFQLFGELSDIGRTKDHIKEFLRNKGKPVRVVSTMVIFLKENLEGPRGKKLVRGI